MFVDRTSVHKMEYHENPRFSPRTITAPCADDESDADDAVEDSQSSSESDVDEDDFHVGVSCGKPTFRMRAPGSSTEEEADSNSDGESDASPRQHPTMTSPSAGGVGAWARRRARTGGRVRREMQALARVGAATHQAKFLETAALEKELLRTRSAQERAWERQLQLDKEMAFVFEDLEGKMRAVSVAVHTEQARIQSQEQSDRRARAEERVKRVAELARTESEKSKVVQQQLQQEVEKEVAQAKAEMMRREQEAAELARQQEELRQQQQQQQKQQEEEEQERQKLVAKQAQDLQEADEVRKSKETQKAEQKKQAAASARKAPSKADRRLRAAPQALMDISKHKDALDAARALTREMSSAPHLKKERRALDRAVSQHLLQITATRSQVRQKAHDMINLLSQLQDPHQTYCILQVCNKCLYQCESQVAKLPSFAFPLAEVIMACCSVCPPLYGHLVATLAEVCHVIVPRYYIYNPELYESEEAYFQTMGYLRPKREDGSPGAIESTDDYVNRVHGYVMFFAAMLQTDLPSLGPRGMLGAAWTWLARLLNHLPVNRTHISALEVFLKVAGYKLHMVYGNQFLKLLMVISQEYVPKMLAHEDQDARAATTRIATYIQTQKFREPPDGLDMPETDESSVVSA